MKKLTVILATALLVMLQSCYFGAGLVEETLVRDIHLVAINSLDEAEIIYQESGSSVYHVLVQRTVFAVGYNDDFVIAKSHPRDSSGATWYYVIEVANVSQENHEHSNPLTLEQFQAACTQLKVPKDLTFEINLEE